MAARSLCVAVRQRLDTFARNLATPFTDSRRQRFLTDMVPGLVIANHVHLSAIARAVWGGRHSVHADLKRLSRHLGSEHWDKSPLADKMLADAARLVSDDTLIPADKTDLAKPYARKLEGLGRVHDGSDPDKRLVAGYAVFSAYVRLGRVAAVPLAARTAQDLRGGALERERGDPASRHGRPPGHGRQGRLGARPRLRPPQPVGPLGPQGGGLRGAAAGQPQRAGRRRPPCCWRRPWPRSCGRCAGRGGRGAATRPARGSCCRR